MEDGKMSLRKIMAAVTAGLVALSVSSIAADAGTHKRAFKRVHTKSIMQATRILRTKLRTQGVMPPFAYIQFCVRHRSSCRNTSGHLAMAGTNSVKLTARLQNQLATVNTRVNSRIHPKSDVGGDKWAIGGRTGDCEDFALTKRALLIAAGWPSRALSLTVVKTAWGEGHAVLSVRTSGGTLVLDNLSRAVRSIRAVPYRIVAMQGGSSMQWSRRSDL
jgi:predicted transglutaminase-like cysteine proteinase